jgi:hypothetical protein
MLSIYFPVRKRTDTDLVLQPWCQTCTNAYHRKYKASHPEQRQASARRSRDWAWRNYQPTGTGAPRGDLKRALILVRYQHHSLRAAAAETGCGRQTIVKYLKLLPGKPTREDIFRLVDGAVQMVPIEPVMRLLQFEFEFAQVEKTLERAGLHGKSLRIAQANGYLPAPDVDRLFTYLNRPDLAEELMQQAV